MAPLPPPNRKLPSKSTSTSTSSTTLSNPYQPPHRISKSPLKRAKLHSKHSALLSRITKRTPHTTSNLDSQKRRRPSKKLITNLDALADALPTTTTTTSTTPHNATGTNDAETPLRSPQEQEKHASKKKIQHKSLKSQRGAGKKKEKIVAMERERFARNLAEMARGGGTDGKMDVDDNVGKNEGGGEGEKVGGGSAERWAAIRGFIRERMERRVGGETGGVNSNG